MVVVLYLQLVKLIQQMNDLDFLSQVLWGNHNFNFQNKCLSFQNRIDWVVIYIEDVFESEGMFLSEISVFSQLSDTRNWIRKYKLVKKVLKTYVKTLNTSLAKYVNIKNLYIPYIMMETKINHL